MSTVQKPETFLLDLDTANANKLMLEPALNYENVLQDRLGMIQVEIGKDKILMNHLSKPNNVLQPKSNCKTWNPTVRYSLRPDEIQVSDYEVNGEQCSDEWEKLCARNLLGYQEDSIYARNAPALQRLQVAMVQTLAQSIVDSAYKSFWFSDTTFNTGSYEYNSYMDNDSLLNSGLIQTEIDNLTNMLQVQDGIWKQIYDYVGASQMAYVDTNDGTAAGNYMKAANILNLFRDMKAQADPILKFWNFGPGNSIADRPAFYLQYGLYQAFMEYLEGTSTEAGYQLVLDGTPVEGVYVWNGHPVYAIPEWTLFDSELGLIHPTTGFSRIQRAIFCAPRNLTLLANVKSLQGFGNSGLIIEQSTQIRDKGVKWMYYTTGLGMSFAHEKLMVAGFNSDLDTFD